MATIRRSALVMHSDEAMFSLVNDVASYPLFMDGCHTVEVFEHTDQTMLARLDLKKAGVQISLMTRNNLTAPSKIEMTLEDGPFKTFLGVWTFKALTDTACKVSLPPLICFLESLISLSTPYVPAPIRCFWSQ